MTVGAEPKRVVSWCFDLAVMITGGLIGLLAILAVLQEESLDTQWWVSLVMGVPVIFLMSRFPLVLNRASGGIEVGFDSAVLVFLACVGNVTSALAIWGNAPLAV